MEFAWKNDVNFLQIKTDGEHIVTTIGKRGYTSGICEMTAMSQLYTRKMPIYDENLVYDWYTLPIYHVYTSRPFRRAFESKDVTSPGYIRPEDTFSCR